MDEIYIWRAAKILMKRYGKTASLAAAVRAESHRARGDKIGFLKWNRIVSAIDELERDRPAEDESIN